MDKALSQVKLIRKISTSLLWPNFKRHITHTALAFKACINYPLMASFFFFFAESTLYFTQGAKRTITGMDKDIHIVFVTLI